VSVLPCCCCYAAAAAMLLLLAAAVSAHLRVADESDALKDGDRPNDQSKIRRYTKGEFESNLGEICRQLLEVDRFGAAAC